MILIITLVTRMITLMTMKLLTIYRFDNDKSINNYYYYDIVILFYGDNIIIIITTI